MYRRKACPTKPSAGLPRASQILSAAALAVAAHGLRMQATKLSAADAPLAAAAQMFLFSRACPVWCGLGRRMRRRTAKHSAQSPNKYCATIPSDSIVPSGMRAGARKKLTLTATMQPPKGRNPKSQMSAKFSAAECQCCSIFHPRVLFVPDTSQKLPYPTLTV